MKRALSLLLSLAMLAATALPVYAEGVQVVEPLAMGEPAMMSTPETAPTPEPTDPEPTDLPTETIDPPLYGDPGSGTTYSGYLVDSEGSQYSTTYWDQLTSEEGVTYGLHYRNFDWTEGDIGALGTINETPTVTMLSMSYPSEDWSNHVTARAYTENGAAFVNVKLDEIPSSMDYNNIGFMFSFADGSQVNASLNISERYLWPTFTSDSGDNGILLKAGSTLTGKLTLSKGSDGTLPLDEYLSDSTSCSYGSIGLNIVGSVEDYIETTLNLTTGVCTVTVKKDMQFAEGSDYGNIQIEFEAVPGYRCSAVNIPVYAKRIINGYLRKPGEQYSSSSAYWDELLSPEGKTFQLQATVQGEDTFDLSKTGSMLTGDVALTLTNYMGDYSNLVHGTITQEGTDSYLTVKLDSMPAIEKGQYLNLTVTADFADGSALVATANCQASCYNIQFTSDSYISVLGSKQGNTLTGTLSGVDSDILNIATDFSVSGVFGVSLPEGKTWNDLFATAYDASTKKLTVTVLQDLDLGEGTSYSLSLGENNLIYDVDVNISGAKEPSINGQLKTSTYGGYASLYWPDMMSEEGKEVQIVASAGGEQITDLSTIGTLKNDVQVTLKNFSGDNGGGHVTASNLTTVDGKTTVALHLDAVPQNPKDYYTLTVVLSFEDGTKLQASGSASADYIGAKFESENVLNALGTAKGSSITGRIVPYSSNEEYDFGSMEMRCTSGSDITAAKPIQDCYSVVYDKETDRFTITSLEDVTVPSGRGTLYLTSGNEIYNINVTVSVGIPELSIDCYDADTGYCLYSDIPVFGPKEVTLIPKVAVQGVTKTLREAGLTDYTAGLYDESGNRIPESEMNVTVDPATGNLKLNIIKAPEFYDPITLTPTSKKYMIRVEKPGVFIGKPLNLSHGKAKLAIQKNGQSDVAIPSAVGTYVYDIVAMDTSYRDQIEMPSNENYRFECRVSCLDEEGKAVPFTDYTSSYNPTTHKMSITFNKEVPTTGYASLYITAFISPQFAASGSAAIEKKEASLELYATDGSGRAGSFYNEEETHSYNIYLEDENTGSGVYQKADGTTVPDSCFTISELTPAGRTPIKDSQYFDASIQGGVLTITQKAEPENFEVDKFGVSISYAGELGEGSAELVYLKQGVINKPTTISWNLYDPQTGVGYPCVSMGNPGTEVTYDIACTAYASSQTRAATSSRSVNIAPPVNGASSGYGYLVPLKEYADDVVSGFTIKTDLSNINDYVTLDYDRDASQLTFHFLKELPRKSDGSGWANTFTLEPVLAKTTQFTVSSKELFSVNVTWLDGGNSVYGMISQQRGTTKEYGIINQPAGAMNALTENYTLDTIVKTLNNPSASSNGVEISKSEKGYLSIAIAPDAVANSSVSMNLNGLAHGSRGTVQFYNYLYVSPMASASVSYRAYSYKSNGNRMYTTLSDDQKNLHLQSYDYRTTEFTLADNSAESFEITTQPKCGTVTQSQNGWIVQWDRGKLLDEQNKDSLVLTATFADGSQRDTKISVSGNYDDYGVRLKGQSDLLPIFSGTWVVGKAYEFEVVDAASMADKGETLKNVLVPGLEAWVKISNVQPGGTFTVTPLKTGKVPSSKLVCQIEGSDGLYSRVIYTNTGDFAPGTSRAHFVDVNSGAILTEVTRYDITQPIELTLDIEASLIEKVEYGCTTSNEVVGITQNATAKNKVTVQYKSKAMPFDTYLYAVITLTDGRKTSAFLKLGCSNDSDVNKAFSDGNQMYLGGIVEDGSFSSYGGVESTVSDYKGSNKVFVMYASAYANYSSRVYEASNPNVDKVEARSTDDSVVHIEKVGEEDGKTFVQYTVNREKPAYAEIVVTATLKDGGSVSRYFSVKVTEAAARKTIRVTNTEELTAALASSELVPNTTIYLAKGTYTGDFVVEVPRVTLVGEAGAAINYNADGTLAAEQNQPIIQGSVSSTASALTINGLTFQKTEGYSDTAVSDIISVNDCIFMGYDTGVVPEDKVNNSISPSINRNVFQNNKNGVQAVARYDYVYLSGNRFINNDVAFRVARGCSVGGSYSPMFNATTAYGVYTKNRFYLTGDQKVLVNPSSITVNLTYNYYNTDEGEQPSAALFEGPALYNPYYTTTKMDTINTTQSVDSTITLVASANTQNPDTVDSSLSLSEEKFNELKESADENVTDLKVNVKSTGGETDVIWNFPKAGLKSDEEYTGDGSVNLGVSFSFDDYEQDVVSNIVKKTKHDENADINNITYQAMHFAHSGDLPGTAKISIRMNSSLLSYYTEHGSMDGFKIYHINEETAMLEKMDVTPKVEFVNNVYYMYFTISHCSSYIATLEDLRTDVAGIDKITLKKDDTTYAIEDDLLTGIQMSTTVDELLSHLSGGAITVKNAEGETVTGTARLGTGYTLGLGLDGTLAPLTVVQYGDINGDTKIDIRDLAKMRRCMLGTETLEGAALKAATPIGKKSIPKPMDLSRLRRYILGTVDSMIDGN